jgi:hypothetical protein
MAIQHTSQLLHWNYFLALEGDLERLSRFVEFVPSNYKCHSVEMVRLLLSAGSEVDVVSKAICGKLDPEKNPQNINQYKLILTKHIPKLPSYTLSMPRFGLDLKPWINWRKSKNPDWWIDHNGIKHDRANNFNKAHLKNTLNAVGGLFLLLIELYRLESQKIQLEPVPKLYSAPVSLIGRAHTLDGRTVLHYEHEG